ncbi:MAG: hypothetical protein RR214_01945 [Synergistaceae bacterium]
MIRFVNLGFFGGGGGSSTETVRKRDPKSAELLNMDKAIYGLISPIASRYGGQVSPITVSKTVTENPYNTDGSANSDYVSAMSGKGGRGPSTSTTVTTEEQTYGGDANAWNQSQLGQNYDIADKLSGIAADNSLNLLKENPTYLTKAGTALDDAQKYAVEGQQSASKYYGNADDYLAEHKNLLANGGNAGLSNYMKSIYDSINSNYAKSAGSLIDDAAARGIVNTSTSGRAIQGLSDSASKAAADQYAAGFNTYAQNYLGGADSSKGLAESTLNTANNTVNNLAKIASGYNESYNSGLNGLKTYAGLPTTYYQNALAPIMPAYNYWKDMTDAYYGHEDYDTVVSQGGK